MSLHPFHPLPLHGLLQYPFFKTRISPDFTKPFDSLVVNYANLVRVCRPSSLRLHIRPSPPNSQTGPVNIPCEFSLGKHLLRLGACELLLASGQYPRRKFSPLKL